MMVCQNLEWGCMAKIKTSATKLSSVKTRVNPWDFKPSDTNTRAGPQPGAGDYYGSGVRNPVGKLRDFGIKPVTKKGLKIPPKKLA